MRNKAIGSEHEHHTITLVVADRTNYKPNTSKNSHVAKIYCCTCNRPLNFASIDEWNYWNQQMYTQLTYRDFIEDFINHAPKREVKYRPVTPQIEKKIIYLEVPFKQKDVVKNLGAKWDPHKEKTDGKKGKWYTFTDNPNIDRLKPWIHPDDEILLK